MYLKKVRIENGLDRGCTIYPLGEDGKAEVVLDGAGDQLRIGRRGYDDPTVVLVDERDLVFLCSEIGENRGDTIERLYDGRRRGRGVADIDRPSGECVIRCDDGREIRIGRYTRPETGSVATTLDVSPGEGPALLTDHAAGQAAHALLHGAFAPDA